MQYKGMDPQARLLLKKKNKHLYEQDRSRRNKSVMQLYAAALKVIQIFSASKTNLTHEILQQFHASNAQLLQLTDDFANRNKSYNAREISRFHRLIQFSRLLQAQPDFISKSFSMRNITVSCLLFDAHHCNKPVFMCAILCL